MVNWIFIYLFILFFISRIIKLVLPNTNYENIQIIFILLSLSAYLLNIVLLPLNDGIYLLFSLILIYLSLMYFFEDYDKRIRFIILFLILFSLFIGILFRIQAIVVPLAFIFISFFLNIKFRIKVSYFLVIPVSLILFYIVQIITISDFSKIYLMKETFSLPFTIDNFVLSVNNLLTVVIPSLFLQFNTSSFNNYQLIRYLSYLISFTVLFIILYTLFKAVKCKNYKILTLIFIVILNFLFLFQFSVQIPRYIILFYILFFIFLLYIFDSKKLNSILYLYLLYLFFIFIIRCISSENFTSSKVNASVINHKYNYDAVVSHHTRLGYFIFKQRIYKDIDMIKDIKSKTLIILGDKNYLMDITQELDLKGLKYTLENTNILFLTNDKNKSLDTFYLRILDE